MEQTTFQTENARKSWKEIALLPAVKWLSHITNLLEPPPGKHSDSV